MAGVTWTKTRTPWRLQAPSQLGSRGRTSTESSRDGTGRQVAKNFTRLADAENFKKAVAIDRPEDVAAGRITLSAVYDDFEQYARYDVSFNGRLPGLGRLGQARLVPPDRPRPPCPPLVDKDPKDRTCRPPDSAPVRTHSTLTRIDADPIGGEDASRLQCALRRCAPDGRPAPAVERRALRPRQ
jgi:hypothetical protein